MVLECPYQKILNSFCLVTLTPNNLFWISLVVFFYACLKWFEVMRTPLGLGLSALDPLLTKATSIYFILQVIVIGWWVEKSQGSRLNWDLSTSEQRHLFKKSFLKSHDLIQDQYLFSMVSDYIIKYKFLFFQSSVIAIK